MKSKPPATVVPLMTRASPSTAMRALALPPTVVFSHRAMEDMRILVALCDKEVGWLGVAKRVGREFWVREIFLPEQHVGSAHTTLTSEGLSHLMSELTKEGRASVLDNMFFWGHSHVCMEAVPSHQDDLQMEKLSRNAPWFIRAVLNRHGHMQVDIYLRDEGVSYLNVPWVVHAPVPQKRLAYWAERIGERVKLFEPAVRRGSRGLPPHLQPRRTAPPDLDEVIRDLLSRDQSISDEELEALTHEWEALTREPGKKP